MPSRGGSWGAEDRRWEMVKKGEGAALNVEPANLKPRVQAAFGIYYERGRG
jgi:hypothetical protein